MSKILKGVRILDLSRMLAGPFGSMLLGDLGAEVIKIEEPGTGDFTRTSAAEASLRGISAYFLSINRSKKSITLDLRKEKGRKVFYEMVKKADVVFDNFNDSVHDYQGVIIVGATSLNPPILPPNEVAFPFQVTAPGGMSRIVSAEGA